VVNRTSTGTKKRTKKGASWRNKLLSRMSISQARVCSGMSMCGSRPQE